MIFIRLKGKSKQTWCLLQGGSVLTKIVPHYLFFMPVYFVEGRVKNHFKNLFYWGQEVSSKSFSMSNFKIVGFESRLI